MNVTLLLRLDELAMAARGSFRKGSNFTAPGEEEEEGDEEGTEQVRGYTVLAVVFLRSWYMHYY